MNKTIKFEIGKEYTTRSACDHDCNFAFTVISRSDKFITVKGEGRTRRAGITIHGGVESAMPFGKYSMAPVIRAA
jgi:hypothetical protein